MVVLRHGVGGCLGHDRYTDAVRHHTRVSLRTKGNSTFR